MANKKLCLKDYLTCPDDKMLSKTRKKMNKKSHKGRYYGTDHGYQASNLGGDAGGDAGGGAMGESVQHIEEMHNGALPGAFSANVLSRMPDGTMNRPVDTKKSNRRNAPRKRSFADFLSLRHRAEEEEIVDDEWESAFRDDTDDEWEDDSEENMNDLEHMDFDNEPDDEGDDFMGAFDDEALDPEDEHEMGLPSDSPDADGFEGDDRFAFLQKLKNFSHDHGISGQGPVADNETGEMFNGAENEEEFDDFEDDEFDEEPDDEFGDEFEDGEFEDDEFSDDEFSDDEFEDDEFDDIDAEDELDFDDESEITDDDIEGIARTTGRFVDFYRDDEDSQDEFGDNDFEEEEEPNAGGEMGVGPGGFEPGQAVGADATSGSSSATKIDRAKILFQQLVNRPGVARGDIIAQFVDQLEMTQSTAVSYYERIAKELGLTNQDENEFAVAGGGDGEEDQYAEMGGGAEEIDPGLPQEEIDQQDPSRQGIIRRVDNAHLVYKRQMEDGGFEELWSYNIGDELDDALTIRRAILSGTDIPRGHTRSSDGQQSYTLSTMGNAQLLHITGLSN